MTHLEASLTDATEEYPTELAAKIVETRDHYEAAAALAEGAGRPDTSRALRLAAPLKAQEVLLAEIVKVPEDARVALESDAIPLDKQPVVRAIGGIWKAAQGRVGTSVLLYELDLTQHSPADADTLKAVTASAGTPNFSDERGWVYDKSAHDTTTGKDVYRAPAELNRFVTLVWERRQETIRGRAHTIGRLSAEKTEKATEPKAVFRKR
ncbi:MAG: hypothetical protein ACM3ZF_02705 [Mycobacterium leprae]